jgi:hypothetical protein
MAVYDSKVRKRTASGASISQLRTRGLRESKSPSNSRRESLSCSGPFGHDEEKGAVVFKKTHHDLLVASRKKLRSQPQEIGIPSHEFSSLKNTANSQLLELEVLLENQCNALLEQLRKLESKQEQNDLLYSQVKLKMADR